jgi:hypothetical protein
LVLVIGIKLINGLLLQLLQQQAQPQLSLCMAAIHGSSHQAERASSCSV